MASDSYWKLVDNEKEPDRKSPEYKLYKLGGLPKLLVNLFGKRDGPTQHLSIHEQMIGRHCMLCIIIHTTHAEKAYPIWVEGVGPL